MARPTDYTESLLDKARTYLDETTDAVPIVVGLCLHIGISKATAYRWAEEGKQEFKDILEEVMEKQEAGLVNGGLKNEFNPTITKMMMTKHGYQDVIKNDNVSSDGSMTPPPTRIELVAPDVNSED